MGRFFFGLFILILVYLSTDSPKLAAHIFFSQLSIKFNKDILCRQMILCKILLVQQYKKETIGTASLTNLILSTFYLECMYVFFSIIYEHAMKTQSP